MKGAVHKSRFEALPGAKSRIGAFSDKDRPKFLDVLAEHYVNNSISYAGKEHDAIIARLGQRVEGIAVGEPCGHENCPPPVVKENRDFLVEAVAAAMRGNELTGLQRAMLLRHGHWLNLPENLQDYAVAYARLAELYGHPERALEQFAAIFEATALPVLKRRLAADGLTPERLQGMLGETPAVDPSIALWALAGASSPYLGPEQDKERIIWHRSPSVLALEEMIARHVSGGEGQHYDLAGFHESQEANNFHGRFVAGSTGAEMMASVHKLAVAPGQQPEAIAAVSMPLGLNKKLDQDRGAWFRLVIAKEGMEALADTYEDAARMVGRGLAHATKVGFLKTKNSLELFFPLAPEALLKLRARAKANQNVPPWTDVPEALRAKFEAAGYDGFKKIAGAINGDQGQQEVKRHIGIILRNTQGRAGYVVTACDIHAALRQPEKARYANGMAVSLLHEKLQAMADPAATLDAFYGLAPVEPQSIEQMASAELFSKVTAAIRQDPLLQHAATDEQLAELLNVKAEELRGLFAHPDRAYLPERNGAGPTPGPVMGAMKEKLGLTFLDEWQAVCQEQRERHDRIAAQMRAAKAAAMNRVAMDDVAPPATPGEPVSPWQDVSETVCEFIRGKFETPEALAGAVAEGIGVKANDKVYGLLQREVRETLCNPEEAFMPNGEPCSIMGARIVEAMGAGRKQAASVFGYDGRQAGPTLIKEREIMRGIATAVLENPSLQRVFGWGALKQRYPKADVPKLVDQLHRAYRLRSQRDPQPVLIASDELVAVVNALNTGLPKTCLYQGDQIVPVNVWREVCRVEMGQDPFKSGGCNDYRLQLG